MTERPADRGAARSLSALLDVRAHEVLGVLLENVVDLVEQVVGVLGQLLATLLAGGRAAGEVVVLAAATATLGLLLSHRCLLRMSIGGLTAARRLLHTTGRHAGLPGMSCDLGGELFYQFGGAVHGVQQRPDVRLAAAQRLQRWNPDQRIAAQVEDHRVPAGRGDVGAEPAQALAAEVGAGVGRRVVHGVDHLLLGDQPLHRTARHQPVVEALVQPHIGVLQVDQVQPRRRPAEVLPAAEALEQPQLGRPVQQLGALHRVALEQVEHVRPGLDDVGGARIGVAAVHQLGHPVQVNPLQRKGGQLAAVGQRDGGAQRRVAADRRARRAPAGPAPGR